MAHEVVTSSHPNMVRMRIYDALTLADMACDAELGLGHGRPVFILSDVTAMATQLPEGFLDGARRSFFVNPEVQHLALVLRSSLLRSVALMVANMTGRRDHISLHDTVDAAEVHLMGLIRQQGL